MNNAENKRTPKYSQFTEFMNIEFYLITKIKKTMHTMCLKTKDFKS